MFEKAVRLKLRFLFRGPCSAEDLWDLSVEDLDVIFKDLAQAAKAQAEESLLAVKNQENEVLNLKIAIVKHIVETKLAEQAERENATLKAGRRAKLLTILAKKQDAGLEELDEDELQGMINELE